LALMSSCSPLEPPFAPSEPIQTATEGQKRRAAVGGDAALVFVSRYGAVNSLAVGGLGRVDAGADFGLGDPALVDDGAEIVLGDGERSQ